MVEAETGSERINELGGLNSIIKLSSSDLVDNSVFVVS
jgi:hypothetical protein